MALVTTSSRDRTARLWNANNGERVGLPIRNPSGVTTVAFNPKGVSLLAARGDSSVLILDTPPYDQPPPWLADLAEFAATQIKYEQLQPDLGRVRLPQTELLASKSTDPWPAFGRWYFADSNVRPISLWSTVSLQQYVGTLIALGDKDSLDYANTLSFDHLGWMAKIVRIRARYASAAPGKSTN